MSSIFSHNSPALGGMFTNKAALSNMFEVPSLMAGRPNPFGSPTSPQPSPASGPVAGPGRVQDYVRRQAVNGSSVAARQATLAGGGTPAYGGKTLGG